MNITCESSSTLIECSGVDKNTAKDIAVLLGLVVQDFENDLDFMVGNEAMGSWLEGGDFSLFIDEGSDAETKYNSLGGEEWIRKLLIRQS